MLFSSLKSLVKDAVDGVGMHPGGLSHEQKIFRFPEHVYFECLYVDNLNFKEHSYLSQGFLLFLLNFVALYIQH